MNIKPLKNTILFKFVDETAGKSGAFLERTSSGIVLPKILSEQKESRWAEVTAVGPDVYGVSIGEYILIAPLMWTLGCEFEGEKIWKTIDDHVLMVTDDLSLTVKF